ncbi:bifunctional folylpolyglutamate synthase/dihydrofolate synthase [Terricaulis sp.]|uniref:bifunctional folylpolyglutamate synthase/dihydrofolate synthase n=1 Tax=Terricaulis sp. TaxID=2768686 RepID=UPI002AC3DACF|nr:cyanophycin synthetase [Terricaulis sp.]MDZ4692402.1 cyanophycin synthetase [Terricaulis sp.]
MNTWRIPYPKFGEGPGLQRLAAIAAELGVDLGAFGATGAVIVGSNGKGSTAAMTAALLEQVSGPVGLFTSPHLLDLNERFRIDGADIEDAALGEHWRRVTDAATRAGEAARLGAFEFLFLIAADWFAARDCTRTVWEAGIGGRLDPVRLIEARRLALTSLDYEHTALLGDTLEEIARDKLDAAPPGALVLVSESCIAQRAAIEAHCEQRKTKCAWIGAEREAPLRGASQRQNAALALRLAQDVVELSEAQVKAGLAATRWPARLEQLSADPLVVIDVGHTPAGVAAALEGFAELRGARDAALVVGVSHDKDAAAIIGALAPNFDVIVCVSADHKGAPAGVVAAHASAANPAAEIIVAESVAEARKLALLRARNGAVYVAGGLFIAAEFKAVHLGRDPARLGFF